MQRADVSEPWPPFADQGQAFDALVRQTPDIDVMCSSASWGLAARHAFDPTGVVAAYAEGDAQFVVARSEGRGLTTLEPMELAWGFASPIVGSNVALACELAASTLRSRADWNVCLLGGMPQTGVWQQAVATAFAPFRRELIGTTLRHVASLAGGIDGYLARRSRGLRKQWRRWDAARGDGSLAMVHLTPTPAQADALYDRMLAIEATSWKGQAGSGLTESPMREMYRDLLWRLACRGQARLGFLRRDARDIAYIFGGLLGGTYRGFQFSFDPAFAALSPGGLCQRLTIEAVIAEGATRYDLGGEMAYKRHWAETEQTTLVWLLAAR
ncbi:MAG: GNAT family N-acetyltransferase [Myxococcales bacterium]|nr:GNAT family N-acetyltransferase [Myxococcales bacterium]